jgi:hypothetical protein
MLMEITTGNSGNGNTDEDLKTLIAREHLSFR